MENYLLGKVLMAQLKTKDCIKKLIVSENGDTNFVSIILIIVIVVALAALFREKLTELAEKVFEQLEVFVG